MVTLYYIVLVCGWECEWLFCEFWGFVLSTEAVSFEMYQDVAFGENPSEILRNFSNIRNYFVFVFLHVLFCAFIFRFTCWLDKSPVMISTFEKLFYVPFLSFLWGHVQAGDVELWWEKVAFRCVMKLKLKLLIHCERCDVCSSVWIV